MPILCRAIYCNGVRGPRATRFVRFWASGGANFTKICDSLPWTPMNHRAECDAASFIVGGEIRIRTNKHTQTKNSKRRPVTWLDHCMTDVTSVTPCSRDNGPWREAGASCRGLAR